MVDSISLRQRAKQLRKLADTLDEAASGIEELGQQTSQQMPQSQERVRYKRSAITTARSRDLCYVVLREAGQPMTKAQIMERLRAAKRIITEGSLQSYLSRDKRRLMSLGRGVWSLRPETPLPVPSNNGGG